MLLWNFVNLIDAEGGWLLELIILFLLAGCITRLLAKLCSKFALQRDKLQYSLLVAFYPPATTLIWFFFTIFAANLVTDGYLSQQFADALKIVQHVAIVLVGSWFLLRWKKAAFKQLLNNRPIEEHGKLMGLSKLSTALIVLLTLMLLMEATGQSIATLIAFGGISGLALAIASQEIVANFFGGFMIYINTPFQVHDTISVPSAGVEGVVMEIGWYETHIQSKDMRPMYVPNSLFTKATILNGSRMKERRLNESFAVRHEDLKLVPQIEKEIKAFLKQHPSILGHQKMDVYISEISTSAVELTVQAMTSLTKDEPFFGLRDELFLKVGQALDALGARFAYVTK